MNDLLLLFAGLSAVAAIASAVAAFLAWRANLTNSRREEKAQRPIVTLTWEQKGGVLYLRNHGNTMATNIDVSRTNPATHQHHQYARKGGVSPNGGLTKLDDNVVPGQIHGCVFEIVCQDAAGQKVSPNIKLLCNQQLPDLFEFVFDPD